MTEEQHQEWKRDLEELHEVKAENELTKGLIKMALNELGVPNKHYPSPVANAVDFLREALQDGGRTDKGVDTESD